MLSTMTDTERTRTAERRENGGAPLTLAQAARLASVSRHTVRYWIRSGRLRADHTADGQLAVRLADLEAARAAVHAGGVLPAWRRDRRSAGLRLRSRREAAGLSQLDLAAVSGVTHETISRLELGRRAPHAETVRRLARALETTPGELVAGDRAPDGYLTAREAAVRLGMGEQAVRRRIDAGYLPAVKVSGWWRIPASALAAAPKRRAIRRPG